MTGGRPGLLTLIREDIDSVLERDPAARTRFEVFFTYPGLHAIMVHRLAHRLWRRGWKFPARLLSFLARMVTNVDIHPGATIGRRLFIDHGAGVVIGETAELGDDVTLYHGVTLGGTTLNKGKRHPTLRDRVLVGAGAKILGPVVIGEGANVGANSVVINDVAPGMTVVGIPGRVVLPPEHRRIAHGIDLDHHLMPDPVGKAIGCLLERIELLEARLAAYEKQSAGTVVTGFAPDHHVCESCKDPCGSLPPGEADSHPAARPAERVGA